MRLRASGPPPWEGAGCDSVPASRFPRHSPEFVACVCRRSSGGGLQTRGFGATWSFQALPEKLPGLAAQRGPQPSPWNLGHCDLSWQQEPRSCDSGYGTPGGETILDCRGRITWVLQRRALSRLMAGRSESERLLASEWTGGHRRGTQVPRGTGRGREAASPLEPPERHTTPLTP